MRHLESQIQISCVTWFRLQYKDVLIFKTPNEGKRNARTAVIMKREGMQAGVADLCILKASKDKHALFIELKFENAKQTLKQKEFEEYCNKNNYEYRLCNTVVDFMSAVKCYFGEVIERIKPMELQAQATQNYFQVCANKAREKIKTK